MKTTFPTSRRIYGAILLAVCITLLFLVTTHLIQVYFASVGWHDLASVGWHG